MHEEEMNDYCYLFLLILPTFSLALKFVDVTEKIQLNNLLAGNYAIGAIADQNADKWSDLLLVNKRSSGQGNVISHVTITYNTVDDLIVLLWDKGRETFTNSQSIL